MRVSNIRVERSPAEASRVRLSADVAYSREPVEETYWVEVDDHLEDSLCLSGDPWLVGLLPIAVTLDEELEIDAPVDRRLASNLAAVQSVWNGWYPWLSQVTVKPTEFVDTQANDAAAGAVFFSGGVDSLFSLLRKQGAGAEINHLISVHGFDIPLSNQTGYDDQQKSFGELAKQLGLNLVSARTNLRETSWRYANWGRVSHGCALAFIANSLPGIINNATISSTFYWSNLIPWGSHPATDPMLSGASVTIDHFGEMYTRVEKTDFIADYNELMPFLHVCYIEGSEKNCGRCEKCLRTVVTLQLLGYDPSDAFADTSNAIADYCTKPLASDSARAFAAEIAELAEQRGNADDARAIRENIVRGQRIEKTQRYNPKIAMREAVLNFVQKRPGLRRRLRKLKDRLG